MARRPIVGDSHQLRLKLVTLLADFEHRLENDDLREQVQALVPALHLLRDLGSSLISDEEASSARARIIYYLQRYRVTIIPGAELAVVAGIDDYTRRIRELRVEHGWSIYSGATAKEMLTDDQAVGGAGEIFGPRLPSKTVAEMTTDDYLLVGKQDRDAAHRWNLANDIRKADMSVQDRLLRFFLKNIGTPVTGEELRYVARGASEWARRVRELRTEEGWSIHTRNSGSPSLAIGVYEMESDRQMPVHDRRISDRTRVVVLERDEHSCQCCGWTREARRLGDPRFLLEPHHIDHHISRGPNEAENLITLCNVDHDEVHRLKIDGRVAFLEWFATACSS